MRGIHEVAVVAAGTVAFVFVGGGLTASRSGSSDDGLFRATQVALAETGGGQVTDTETGDEDSFYEIEVTLEGGRLVDVQIDEFFSVVSARADAPATDGD